MSDNVFNCVSKKIWNQKLNVCIMCISCTSSSQERQQESCTEHPSSFAFGNVLKEAVFNQLKKSELLRKAKIIGHWVFGGEISSK